MESPFKQAPCCCSPPPPASATGHSGNKKWTLHYTVAVIAIALLWGLAYAYILPIAHWFVSDIADLDPASRLGASLEFFIYDTVKIYLLLVGLIYGIAWARASLDTAKIRAYLVGKRRGAGYFLGAVFGAITPFCSCSSIPLFLGFTAARIPLGISMAFLITSPLINEIAIVLLWGLLGWKFTIGYVVVGLLAGSIGGFVMDRLQAEKWLQPSILSAISNAPEQNFESNRGGVKKLTVRQRHIFASSETSMIFKKVWKWVLVGVGIGAALHGFVPQNWFAENFGAQEWWTVPAAVFVAIPLYSNVTGIIPVMESLLLKGLPLGTTMAFCMSAVVASIPEFMMLRQIMTIKLQALFIAYLWIMLTLIGWLFNFLQPYLLP